MNRAAVMMGRSVAMVGAVAAAVAIGWGGSSPAVAAPTCPVGTLEAGNVCQVWYRTTGHAETFTVPDGVTSVRLLAKGGDGGMGSALAIPVGRPPGGVVQAALAVTGGEQLEIVAGGRGTSATDIGGTELVDVPGGFGGGGASCAIEGSGGGGGGGGSFVFRRDAARSLVVAAGGAGGAGSVEIYGVPDMGGPGGGDGPGGVPPLGASTTAPGPADTTAVVPPSYEQERWPTGGSGPATLDPGGVLAGSDGGRGGCVRYVNWMEPSHGLAGGGGGGGLYGGGGGTVRFTARLQGDHYVYERITAGGGGGSGTITAGAVSAEVPVLGGELGVDGAVIVQYDADEVISPTTSSTRPVLPRPTTPGTSGPVPGAPGASGSSASTTSSTSTTLASTSTTPGTTTASTTAPGSEVVVQGTQVDVVAPATGVVHAVRPARSGALARTGAPVGTTAVVGFGAVATGAAVLAVRRRFVTR